MKIIFSFLVVITICIYPQNKILTTEDLFESTQFVPEIIKNIQWLPDESAFTYTENSDIYKYDIKSGSKVLLLKGSELLVNELEFKINNYKWTEDAKYLLIEGPVKTIWRHSSQAPYILYNVQTKMITPLSNGDQNLRNVKLSPDGTKVGFVRNHNLFVTDLLGGKETAITDDGNENILYGEFDWVYEEEFSISDGWQWSPDGKRIAFWRFDQTHVKEFYLIDEMTNYNKISTLKYPKTGERNSIIKIGVAEIETSKLNWMNLGNDDDIYIPRIYWTNSSSKLAIIKLNRLQNHLELIISDTEMGTGQTIIEEKDSCWVEADDNSTIFLKNKNEIVWVSERSGYRHAYIYDYEGNLIKQITSGSWEMTSLLGVDENNGLLFFDGKKDSPIEQHIYRINLDGSSLKKLSDEHGWHTANFSPDYKYFINEFSNVQIPSRTYLKMSDGTLLATLKQNDLPAFKEYNMVYPEFSAIKTADGVDLNCFIMKPADFDMEKKYPVIVYGYGGPGSQHVINKWTGNRQLWHQVLTENGFIIFCVDNRGTGGRGKYFKNLAYGDLGNWSVRDQVEGAKYLQSLSYVDKDKIGFWGWSGGGYLCLMLMTRATEYFKVGIAVAPVCDFRNYDAIWSERYLGLLDKNPEWYDRSAPLSYASQLNGKLLIVHGTGDDNVHYQNTMQMVRAFQLSKKPFDLMLYPNKNHGLAGETARQHLHEKMTDYFIENLKYDKHLEE
jgi:dipeptidyl-peptidase-4